MAGKLGGNSTWASSPDFSKVCCTWALGGHQFLSCSNSLLGGSVWWSIKLFLEKRFQTQSWCLLCWVAWKDKQDTICVFVLMGDSSFSDFENLLAILHAEQKSSLNMIADRACTDKPAEKARTRQAPKNLQEAKEKEPHKKKGKLTNLYLSSKEVRGSKNFPTAGAEFARANLQKQKGKAKSQTLVHKELARASLKQQKGKGQESNPRAQKTCTDKPEETKGKGQESNPSAHRACTAKPEEEEELSRVNFQPNSLQHKQRQEQEQDKQQKFDQGKRRTETNKERTKRKRGAYTPQPTLYPGKGEEQLPDREHRACRGKPEDTKRQRKGKGAAYNPRPKAYKGMGTQQLPTKELWCDNCWQRSHSTQVCWWKGNNQQTQKHPKKQAWHRPGSKKQLERDIGDQTFAQWLASNKSLMSSFEKQTQDNSIAMLEDSSMETETWAELHEQKLASAASSSTDLDEATRSTRQEAEQSSLISPCHSALPQATGKEKSSFVCLFCESVGSVSGGELLDNGLHPFQQPKSQEQQQLHNQHLRSTQLGSEKLEEAKGKGASKKKSRSSEKTLEDVLSSACVYNLPDLV